VGIAERVYNVMGQRSRSQSDGYHVNSIARGFEPKLTDIRILTIVGRRSDHAVKVVSSKPSSDIHWNMLNSIASEQLNGFIIIIIVIFIRSQSERYNNKLPRRTTVHYTVQTSNQCLLAGQVHMVTTGFSKGE